MTLHHSSRCARRLRKPLLIFLGLAISLSGAVAHEERTPGAQSSGVNLNKPAHFQVWRKITLGVLMLIAVRWIQRELKLAMLQTKSSVGPGFLMER
jgi:hypothetical protein